VNAGARHAARQLALVTHGQADVLLSRSAMLSARTWLSERLQWILGYGAAPAVVDFAVFLDSCSLCNVLITQWIAFLSEFCIHVEDFAKSLNHKRSKPFITQLTCGLSDPHDGGRTVIRARLHNCGTWYYKPRSGREEHAWNGLLQQLNHRGFESHFLVTEVVPRGNHCWMREIPHVLCSTRPEMKRFYFRCGSLLYLAHVLRAVDLHADNLVAHREHPVLIDCETFLQPKVRIPSRASHPPHSASRCGMLPSGRVGNSKDPSFLGQKTLRVRARALGLRDAAPFVVAGFAGMHSFLKEPATRKQIHSTMKSLESQPVRCIYRPTYLYAELLAESLRRFSEDQNSRRHWLKSKLKDGICNATLVEEETAQLIRCDIPIFYKRAAAIRPRPTSSELLDACREIQGCLDPY
jgi:lantibiotic modifying enzyme